MAKAPYIFISYAHSDSAPGGAIAQMLQETGIDYFLDTKDIDWGGDIDERVAVALARSSHVLVIVSPASLQSPWVSYEVGQAKAMGKTLLPLLTQPDLVLPVWLAKLSHLVDLADVKPLFERLAAGAPSADPRTQEAVSAEDRDEVRESRNRRIMELLKGAEGIRDCSVLQLEDHSDAGYLLFVEFDEALTSSAAVLKDVRNAIDRLFPDVPYWGEAKFEESGSVGFAFTYIDEHNRLLR